MDDKLSIELSGDPKKIEQGWERLEKSIKDLKGMDELSNIMAYAARDVGKFSMSTAEVVGASLVIMNNKSGRNK